MSFLYFVLASSVNDGLLKKLQAVQNAAARVTTETRKFDHITPILRELHWLPVRKRIVYKLARENTTGSSAPAVPESFQSTLHSYSPISVPDLTRLLSIAQYSS